MINLKVRGLEGVKESIDNIRRNARGAATEAAADYIIGTQGRGPKHYPAYKYVNRYAGFPELVTELGNVGYKSERQRGYVMAKIRSGEIDPGVPHRTGLLQRGWERKGDGTKSRIVNEIPYAKYVMGDEDQVRMHKLIGWRVVSKIIADNLKGAIQAAERAVQKLAGK